MGYTWYTYESYDATSRWFMVMNYPVHSLMYTYYGLKVCYLSYCTVRIHFIKGQNFFKSLESIYPVAMTVSFTFIAIVDFLIAVKVTVQNVLKNER
jgi:hypothetical protein